MPRYLLWDFDGTLANREGMWSAAFRDAIVRYLPTAEITIESIRPFLSSGFPWHSPEVAHHHLSSSEVWWHELQTVFARAAGQLGIKDELAALIAGAVREEYLKIDSWKLNDNALETLCELSDAGWTHIITSNHVPELPQLVAALELDSVINRIFCSAALGVEKPNPLFFSSVLADLDARDEVWVIGDSVRADIMGARSAGLPSILIGPRHAFANHCASSLREVADFLVAGD